MPIVVSSIGPFAPAVKPVSCGEGENHTRYGDSQKDFYGASRHHFFEVSRSRRLPVDDVGAHQCLMRFINHDDNQYFAMTYGNESTRKEK